MRMPVNQSDMSSDTASTRSKPMLILNLLETTLSEWQTAVSGLFEVSGRTFLILISRPLRSLVLEEGFKIPHGLMETCG